MELFTFYKDYSRKPCIYAITNKINGKIYIGKTKCFKIRHYQHKYSFFSKNGNIVLHIYITLLINMDIKILIYP